MLLAYMVTNGDAVERIYDGLCTSVRWCGMVSQPLSHHSEIMWKSFIFWVFREEELVRKHIGCTCIGIIEFSIQTVN